MEGRKRVGHGKWKVKWEVEMGKKTPFSSILDDANGQNLEVTLQKTVWELELLP